MDWKALLTYITGAVDQALLLHHEYLVNENRWSGYRLYTRGVY